ncbi:MAG: hypothetical protein ACXAD7_18740 [Candidatus Kariarchaeaceae archaeon]
MNIEITRLINKRLEKAFYLTFDLYKSLDEPTLKLRIGNYPSNTIGNQAWCVIGARESYFNAIKNSKWMGFQCSLKNINIKSDILQLFESLTQQIIAYLDQNSLSIDQLNFVFDLLEHEIQHHGQLIRYFYSNKLKFPTSWNERYTV